MSVQLLANSRGSAASYPGLAFGFCAEAEERECCRTEAGRRSEGKCERAVGQRTGCRAKICKKCNYFAVQKTRVLFCVRCPFLKAAELRAYLKSKGAEISEENAEGGLHVDLAQIIEVCDVCLKEDDKGLCL